ncbi:hypothetical protein C8R44DRAFT_752263 [Mycena epipterygia]|nr:hypothetical protein C8R44DRAFT_752263 [Mycena epipterygia]
MYAFAWAEGIPEVRRAVHESLSRAVDPSNARDERLMPGFTSSLHFDMQQRSVETQYFSRVITCGFPSYFLHLIMSSELISEGLTKKTNECYWIALLIEEEARGRLEAEAALNQIELIRSAGRTCPKRRLSRLKVSVASDAGEDDLHKDVRNYERQSCDVPGRIQPKELGRNESRNGPEGGQGCVEHAEKEGSKERQDGRKLEDGLSRTGNDGNHDGCKEFGEQEFHLEGFEDGRHRSGLKTDLD